MKRKELITLLGIVLGVCLCIFFFRVAYDSFATAPPAAPAAAAPAAAAPAAPAAPAAAQTPVPDATQTAIQNMHTTIPLMDMKMINTLKTSLNNIITQRPDVIQAINYVFSDPQIHQTLVQMLFVLKQQ
jgi:hypothetical protein